MLVLTVVAVRLIGLWLIASHFSGVVVLALSVLNLPRAPAMDEIGAMTFIATGVAAALPLVAGVMIILFSVALSRMVVPVKAHDLPAPAAVSPKTVVQVGVFLIGLWLIGTSLPVVVAMAPYFGLNTAPEYLAGLVLGLLLMLGSGLLAGLVGKLRNWP